MRYLPALLITLALAPSASACFPVQPANGTALTTDAVAAKPELKLIWRAHVSGMESFAFRPQEYARPVFVTRSDDVIVGTSDGNVTRLRAGSGEVVWRKLLLSTREDGINGGSEVSNDELASRRMDYSDGTGES